MESKDRTGYPFFPLFVDLSGKKLVVVGAGRIAKRRIETLVQFSGNVTAVAPEVHPELAELEAAGVLRVCRKCYERADLAGAALVFAATNDRAVNETVWRDCKRLGIPVNVGSDRTKSDFYFPGIARRDNLVIGVTASGRDHAEAKRVTGLVRELLQ